MSKKLNRSRVAARTLRMECLEDRRLLHAHPLAIAETVAPPDELTAADATSQPADLNGDGRLSLGEYREWLKRRQPTAQPKESPATDQPRTPVEPDVLPAVGDYGGPDDWHLNAIGAPEAWAAGYTGAGVTVAVIDTGVDLRHPELRDQLWRNPGEVANNGRDDDGNGFIDDVHGWDFVDDDATPQDRNGHGTHVAGLIVAARDERGSTGAAYGSQLMVLQAVGADGVGSSGDVARAIRYAVDEGADLINVSLSGGRSASLESAIRYAAEQDVLIVAAAGNQAAAQPAEPAGLSRQLTNVLSVGAYDQNSQMAGFSNRAGDALQITAPGVRLRSTVPGGYARYSGTSMAAPLATAVAALTLNAAPQLSADQLRSLLLSNTETRVSGDDSHGAVDAAAAVAQGRKQTRLSVASLDEGPATLRFPQLRPADVDAHFRRWAA